MKKLHKVAVVLAASSALVLGGAVAPAHAAPINTSASVSVDVQPTHHRKYNKPTCYIALTFVLFTGWRTVEENCGGHRKIT